MSIQANSFSSRQFFFGIFIWSGLSIGSFSNPVWAAGAEFKVSLSCDERIEGDWKLGTAAIGCKVDSKLSSLTQKQYGPVVFDETMDKDKKRSQYVTNMHSFLKETSRYYLLRRNPKASEAEIRGFTQAVFSLAHQESYWTHYRLKKNVLRYMRGDGLHGHGLMQVDDRWHGSALRKGRGVDLMYNIVYGLDIYYQSWKRAAHSSCVKSSTDYRSRARAAWAAYNGGPGSLCRWSNGGHHNDQGFKAKYDNKDWAKFILDKDSKSGINVTCLAEGPRPCALTEAKKEKVPAVVVNSSELQGLPKVGSWIRVKAAVGMHLRSTPAGEIIDIINQNEQMEVRGVQILNSERSVYLRVKINSRTGYVYVGHLSPTSTVGQWLEIQNEKTQPNALKVPLAVTNSSGESVQDNSTQNSPGQDKPKPNMKPNTKPNMNMNPEQLDSNPSIMPGTSTTGY